MACYPSGLALNSKTMSDNATFDQAGHIFNLLKGITKEEFEAMKPLLSDLRAAGLGKVKVNRDAYRKTLGLSPLELVIELKYGTTLDEMLAKAKFNHVSHLITPENFPVTPPGASHNKAKLFHFKQELYPEEAIRRMNKKGYEPAKIQHLIAFGIDFPEEQNRSNILALGSVLEHEDGYKEYPYLFGDRCIDTHYFDDTTEKSDRFLGIRK